jgi:hypothetical protein
VGFDGMDRHAKFVGELRRRPSAAALAQEQQYFELKDGMNVAANEADEVGGKR